MSLHTLGVRLRVMIRLFIFGQLCLWYGLIPLYTLINFWQMILMICLFPNLCLFNFFREGNSIILNRICMVLGRKMLCMRPFNINPNYCKTIFNNPRLFCQTATFYTQNMLVPLATLIALSARIFRWYSYLSLFLMIPLIILG